MKNGVPEILLKDDSYEYVSHLIKCFIEMNNQTNSFTKKTTVFVQDRKSFYTVSFISGLSINLTN